MLVVADLKLSSLAQESHTFYHFFTNIFIINQNLILLLLYFERYIQKIERGREFKKRKRN